MDVSDLYYSLRPTTLLNNVEEAIRENDVVKFQNECGLSMSVFLRLLKLYLSSLLVEFDGNIYSQKAGVCIGSCVAPVLSEIYLLYVDRAIARRLEGPLKANLVNIFRFVDDYLVVHHVSVKTAKIVSTFNQVSQGLQFTQEFPVNNHLQFLDLSIRLSATGMCWSYQQRSKKPLLPFNSFHSKIVKDCVVKSALKSSLTKSCEHLCGASLSFQLEKLQTAGYPPSRVNTIAKRLILSSRGRGVAPRSSNTHVVSIPYSHGFSHRVKKVAASSGLEVVFRCP